MRGLLRGVTVAHRNGGFARVPGARDRREAAPHGRGSRRGEREKVVAEVGDAAGGSRKAPRRCDTEQSGNGEKRECATGAETHRRRADAPEASGDHPAGRACSHGSLGSHVRPHDRKARKEGECASNDEREARHERGVDRVQHDRVGNALRFGGVAHVCVEAGELRSDFLNQRFDLVARDGRGCLLGIRVDEKRHEQRVVEVSEPHFGHAEIRVASGQPQGENRADESERNDPREPGAHEARGARRSGGHESRANQCDERTARQHNCGNETGEPHDGCTERHDGAREESRERSGIDRAQRAARERR